MVQLVADFVAKCAEIGDDGRQAGLVIGVKQAAHVFGDEHLGAGFADRLDHRAVKATARFAVVRPFAIYGNVLTREAADHQIEAVGGAVDMIPDRAGMDGMAQIMRVGAAGIGVQIIDPGDIKGLFFL